MSDLYLISDTHFGHNNIRKYENRPFDSVEEMDSALITNWNKVVHKRATVICLGDFSFYGFEKTKAIFDQLKGLKHLIMGNHDRDRTRTWWKRVGFDIVINNPIILYKEKVILSHEPFKELFPGFINIHGHIHMQKLDPDRHRLPYKGFSDYSNKYINVSCDVTDYKPVKLESILNNV